MEQLKKGGFIQALHLVDDPLSKLNKEKKDVEIRFDSGSEGDSFRQDSNY